jgi:autotransporter-associated beta strand protein
VAVAVSCASIPVVVDQACAQNSYTWAGNTSANWATGSNWSPTFVSWPGGVYNYLSFGAAGTSGTTLNNNFGDGVVTLSGLTFQSNAPAYTINGNRIALWDNTTISNSSSAVQTINTALTFGAGNAFQGNIVLGGTLGGSRFTASSGTLRLTGSSSGFTGGVSLNSGRVVLGNKAALGTGLIQGTGSIEAALDLVGDQSIANGYESNAYGVLTIAGTNSLTTTGNVTLSPAAFQVVMFNNLASGKTFTISGTTTVNGNASVTTLTGSGNTTYAGPIVGSGGNFTSTNTGLTTFSGSNSYSGVTTVSNGTLLTTKPAALPNYSTSSKVSVASGATLAVQAGGAGEWDGTAMDSLLATNAFSAGSSIGVSVTSGNSFQYGNNLGTTQASKGLAKRGAGTLVLSGSNTYTGATLVTGGTLQIGNGGTSGAIDSTSGITLSNNATLAFNRSDNYGGNFTKAISGAGNLVVSAGTLAVRNAVTFTGDTTIEGGVLRLTPSSFASPTAATAQSEINSTWSATQTINGSGMTPNNPVTELSTASNSAAGLSWFSNNTQSTWITWDLGSEKSVSGFHLWNFNASGFTARGVRVAEIYSGTSLLANGSSYASAGSAWGTLVTTGTFSRAPGLSTYTGEDFIFASPVTTRYLQFKVLSNWSSNTDQNTGLSEIGFFSPVGDTLPVTTNVTLSGSGALDINGIVQSVNSLSSSSANARVWLGSGQLTVTGSSSTTFAGRITDSGGANGGVGGKVTKSGLGTLTLTGSNTYTSVTTITGGTLQFGDGGTTGSLADSSAVSIGASAALAFNRSDNLTYGGTISGAGGLTKLGNGRLTLTSSNGFTGSTSIMAGSLIVNGALTGNVVVGSGAVLGGSGVLGQVLSGAGTISVGNSPGIGTAGSVDPAAGTDWVFEITGTAPIWNSGTSASVNDVLRLTQATPFVSNLAVGNVVDVLFNLGVTPVDQGTYLGGFFIDNEAFDLAAALANGQFRYWVAGTYGMAGDQQQFNVGAGGAPVTYSLLSAAGGGLTASYTTSQRTVDFGSGAVTGMVTQFVVVPEPAAITLAGIGVAAAAWALRRRSRRAC